MQATHAVIARDKPNAAAKWVREFHRRAKSLAHFPFGGEIMPEAEEIDRPWRHLIFGSYRILYRVDGLRVTILSVVNAAKLLDHAFFERVERQGER